MILQGLKARLTQAKGSWIDNLYNVLWAYQTIPCIPMRESPFRLAFETKAMILLDIDLPSLWIEQYDHMGNEAALRANLDLLEETR